MWSSSVGFPASGSVGSACGLLAMTGAGGVGLGEIGVALGVGDGFAGDALGLTDGLVTADGEADTTCTGVG
jgi:hypothetical protein